MTRILTDEEIEYARGQYTPFSEMSKAINTIDAKDAKIRVLVEALLELRNDYFEGGDNSSMAWVEGIDEALSTIPAKALERVKLEREVVEAARNATSTLMWKVNALEAHRNKV